MARKRVTKVKTKTPVHYYADLRKLSKVANQRMRELEKRGAVSPAYQSVQAELDMLGKRSLSARGRRFSESGMATYTQYESLMSILNKFVNKQTTSTVRGFNKYKESVWQGALKSEKISADLERAGITKDQWFAMWQSLPDKNNRAYDSEEYINTLVTYNMKHQNENFDVSELMKDFEATTDLKSAYAGLGLSYKDFEHAKSLGVL